VAKLAGNTPAPSDISRKPNADSSGLVDLAALMSEQPNWLDDALARAKASAGVAAAPPSVVPVSLAPALIDVADDSFQAPPRKGALPILLASAGAGLLVAAACAFAVHARASQAPSAPMAPVAAAAVHTDSLGIPPPPAAQDVAAAALPGAAQVTEAPSTAPPVAHAADNEGPPVGRHWRHEHHERAAEAHVAPVAAKAADAPPPAPVRAAAPVAAPPPKSALEAALRASVGNASVQANASAPAPAAAPAAAAPAPRAPVGDGVPERPSGSAVTSTLTEVLGKARRCVEGMSDASRALVTFGSDGAAHKIDVTGPAASDPKAMTCLKAAFSRAHVPPFSSANYSAGVTIRPQ
jgi:hypothetical protein